MHISKVKQKVALALSTTMLFTASVANAGTSKDVDQKAAVTALDTKVAAWNRHDLQNVLNAYADTPDLSVFSTGKDLYGKTELQKQYEAWYGKNNNAMGKISYSDLKSAKLSKNSILLTGHYTLDEPEEKPVAGVFTLVYAKINGTWKIIHEHLSKPNS